ncbi:replicase PB2 [Halyomorpha halys orthomyxo-like virus 1]|nr:replicase PB2 [Halyomorpha halys orthomyxo-like virus 1]WJE88688.1 MAG: polymerase [Halyomorpha halys orthomyxo-like virus 1]
MEEDRKKILLRICKNIMEADTKAIQIMKDTPLCNLRVINRASRNNKDPNPLSSTMAQINTKFPITVDRFKARAFGVPESLLGPDDAHRYGRRICKKEVVDWFLDNVPAPGPEMKQVIDTLFEKPRKDVERFFAVKWRSAKIKFGPVMLERKMIPTQVPALRVPRPLRNKLVMQVLMPDYCLPYQRLDPSLTQGLRQIAQTKLDAKLALVQQVRILTDQMDPKVRIIPAIPGSAEMIGPMRHAICQSNFLVTVDIPPLKGSNDYTKDLISLADSAIWAIHFLGQSSSSVTDLLSRTKIMGRYLPEILDSSDTNTSVLKVKFLMTLLNKPINMASFFKEIAFSPCIANVFVTNTKNRGGFRYRVYKGNEVVHFRKDALRGQFCHNGEIILSITCNFTEEPELRYALAAIGAYCRKEGELTSAKNKKDMLEEIYNKGVRSPWTIIGVTRETYLRDTWEDLGKRGVLEIVGESEFEEAPVFSCKYSFGKDIIILYNSQTKQSIDIPIGNMSYPMISELTEIPPGILDDFLPPRKLLRRKMHFYHSNFPSLWSHIKVRDFRWKNEAFFHLSKGECERPLAQGAWMIINKALNDPNPETEAINMKPLICLAYCFCRLPIKEARFVDIKPFINWCDNVAVDFTAREGVLQVNEDGMYLLFGEPLGVGGTMDYAHMLGDFMPGFSFSGYYDPDLPVKRMSTLTKLSDELHDGSRFTVYVGGRPYTCTKLHSLSLSIVQTIERQMKNKSLLMTEPDLTFTESWLPSRKRSLSEDESGPSSDMDRTAKHRKLE